MRQKVLHFATMGYAFGKAAFVARSHIAALQCGFLDRLRAAVHRVAALFTFRGAYTARDNLKIRIQTIQFFKKGAGCLRSLKGLFYGQKTIRKKHSRCFHGRRFSVCPCPLLSKAGSPQSKKQLAIFPHRAYLFQRQTDGGEHDRIDFPCGVRADGDTAHAGEA